MATKISGRSSRSTGIGVGGSSWGVSGNWGRTTTKRTNKTRRNTGVSGATIAPKYKSVSNVFQNKINSFKTLFNQTKGPARYGRPTTATLNSFANWVNKGAIIQTCTAAQVARWARNTKKNFNTQNPTPTACKNVLGAKFGKTTIKAVARTKSGGFMVATSPTCKGRPFCFPNK